MMDVVLLLLNFFIVDAVEGPKLAILQVANIDEADETRF